MADDRSLVRAGVIHDKGGDKGPYTFGLKWVEVGGERIKCDTIQEINVNHQDGEFGSITIRLGACRYEEVDASEDG